LHPVVQAATVALDETHFMIGTETRMFPFEITEAGHFKATLTDFEFLHHKRMGCAVGALQNM
jgi:hypothetical protein